MYFKQHSHSSVLFPLFPPFCWGTTNISMEDFFFLKESLYQYASDSYFLGCSGSYLLKGQHHIIIIPPWKLNVC